MTIHESQLFVQDLGQSQGEGLPVILLHGFPLDHRMWSRQADALAAAGYRAIIPDLAGMGQSAVPASNIALSRYADDVLALMDKLGIQKAVLGGFSMGGYVVFSLLRKAPERFAAVVLANTRPEADPQEGRKNRMNMAASLYEKGAAAARDAMLPKLLSEESRQTQPELVRELSAVMDEMQPEGLVHASLAMAFREDSVDLLAAIDVPALVIAGEHDPITMPEVMKSMAERIRGASFHIVPGAAHLTPMESPEAFNSLLLDFLKSVKA